MIGRHPHELRTLAREMRYANAQDERATIQAVDQAVFDRVRTYERGLRDEADALQAQAREHAAALVDVIAALEDEIGVPLASGAVPSPALAARYTELQRQYDTIQGEFNLTLRAMEWAEKRAADPYASYMAMMDKWPLLRPQL